MARGWHDTKPNPLYRAPSPTFFLACALCYCSFLFVVFVLFLFCFCFLDYVKTSDLPVALFAFFKSLNQTFWLYRYIFLYVFPLAFTYITCKSIIDTIWFMRCTHGLAIF